MLAHKLHFAPEQPQFATTDTYRRGDIATAGYVSRGT